jgi:dihydrofolate synthase
MSIQLGLEKISALLSAIGNPHHAFNTIHLAGSNGKGSIGNYLSRSISPTVKSGHFSSPFLLFPGDCIRINTEVVDDGIYQEADARVRSVNATLSLGCTEFEILTAVAFLIFSQLEVELAVIEVGLGGLLDAYDCVY